MIESSSSSSDSPTLTYDQKVGIEKYGFTLEQIADFDITQITGLHQLKKYSVTAKDLRDHPKLNSFTHFRALAYLVQFCACPLPDALTMLSSLTVGQASGVSKGVPFTKVNQLKDYQIEFLISQVAFTKISDADVATLSEEQLDFLKRTVHLGVTAKLLLDHPKITITNHHQAFEHLCLFNRMDIETAISLLEDLDQFQATAVADGLTKEEVQLLNKAQINAITELKTVKNQLSGNDFKDKNWFNSEEHVDALKKLMNQQNLTFVNAMQELDQLTPAQAKQIYYGEKRDNIYGLNDWQLKAVEENKYSHKAISGSDIRDKKWFDSAEHFLAFRWLVNTRFVSETVTNKVTCRSEYTIHPHDALAMLDGLDSAGAKLIYRGFTREQVLVMPLVKKKILSECERLKPEMQNEIVKADWLNSEKHYQAFLALNKDYRATGNELGILKQICSHEGGLDKFVQGSNDDDAPNVDGFFEMQSRSSSTNSNPEAKSKCIIQ